MKTNKLLLLSLTCGILLLGSCKKKSDTPSPTTVAATPKDPSSSPVVSVDRFSALAAHLQLRTSTNGIPGPNVPVNFDQAPFITQGFTPSGQVVLYYNFDVQPSAPAPIYVLFKQGDTSSVAGQLNIIDVKPGSPGYNDFWLVKKVTVPTNYVANTVTSLAEIISAGYPITATTEIVNCPVVPKGSTANMKFGGGSNAIIEGWYKDSIVTYFSFLESPLSTNSSGLVPISPIYVTFNINPDQPNGGPASGFMTVSGSVQTHNVIATIPKQVGYSPLWSVDVYDNASFGSVSNLSTAMSAPLKGTGVALVNCPVVSIQ
jgi:hypothetical protein